MEGNRRSEGVSEVDPKPSVDAAERALQEIKSIKKTIDEVTGAAFFGEALFSMGTLFVVGGVMIAGISGITKVLISRYGLTPDTVKVIIGMWALFLIVSGVWKFRIFSKKSAEKGMSFYRYMRKLIGGSFISVELPLVLSFGMVCIYLIKAGEYHYLVSLAALWFGTLIALLGPVFSEKSFSLWGYIYILSGGAGLLFFGEYVLYYTAAVFGVLFVVIGLFMHFRYKSKASEWYNEHSAAVNEENVSVQGK